MAQTVIIKQGNRQLEDVTKIKPDTKVNEKAAIKYPATDLTNGMVEETFSETGESGETIEFKNPEAYVNPDAEDEGETGETETGETETGETETGETESGK